METKQSNLKKIYDLVQNNELQKAFIEALQLEKIYIEDEDVLFLIAGLYELKNDIIRALDYYMKTLKVNNQNDFANFKVGEHIYLLKKNKDLFSKYIDEWQKLAPDNLITKTFSGYLLGEEVKYNSNYIKLLFDNFANSFDSVLGKIAYQTPIIISEYLEKYVKTQAKIIDVGCGTGLCGEVARKHAKKLVGIDVSENMLKKAKEKSIYDDLQLQDIVDIKLKETFDIVISGDVLTYFPDIYNPLKEMRKLLKDKGSMFVSFSIPNKFTFKNVKQEPSGRYLHSKRYIKSVLKNLDLKIVSSKEYNQRKELGNYVKGFLVYLKV